MEVQGFCHPKFAAVKAAFVDNFISKNEIGAAVSIYHKGTKVVDLWAGYKNLKTKDLWLEETTVPFFSVTKGMAALCFLILAERKKLDYNRKVSFYWPEFAMNGKENITVKQLLEHLAGLHALDKKFYIEDVWLKQTEIYEALIYQSPAWNPGTKQAYGAQVWGLFAAELFKKIAKESAGKFFEREVRKKLKLNLYLGLPKELQSNVATIYPISNLHRILKLLPQIIFGIGNEGRAGRAVLKGNSEVKKAYLNPSVGLKGLNAFNDNELHKQELLWANGIGDARSLASIYNVLAMGGKVGNIKFANTSLLKELKKENDLRYDWVVHKPIGWNLGFLKEEPGIFSPNVESFGHAGMGGSVAFADPKAKLSFAYICNQMDYRVRAPKTLSLCSAAYKSLI
ncbi:serine hydrolase [Leptospira sp. 96542]|nr:serine hydrolase [Leptospira sp. 96542]